MADTLGTPLHVEIITPDGPIYTKDGAVMVVARATDGEFAVMKIICPSRRRWKSALSASRRRTVKRKWPYSAASSKWKRTASIS